ncbi:ISLre2 family transposase [Peptostreptococcus anaerobius]|uniref:ISLre2 family transposase n=3 Tax=Bacteria TaxID=2 RepID=A0A6N7WXS4_9FIRM|nr:ISLre2 family transposase [Peptostreptococcus porci]MST61598.1 ISLre2 family transposase [Peptostreptococcus porci]
METIIQQYCLELVKNIEKILIFDEEQDLSSVCPKILEECKKTSKELVEKHIEYMNEKIRKDKYTRKSKGLSLKEKNISRSILTCLGQIEYKRDNYYDSTNKKYIKPMDEILGIKAYERISIDIKAALVDKATEYSYEKSKALVGVDCISRQSVRNAILKSKIENISICKNRERKAVKELHIFADEDHVHTQKPNKEIGRKNQIVPMVSVSEGIKAISKSRRKTINIQHFVDKEFNTKDLWRIVDKYIQKNYDVGELEKLYIHADGGMWIKNGLEDYSQRVYVCDGFHVKKYLNTIRKIGDDKKIVKNLEKLIKENKKEEAKVLLEELVKSCEDERSNKRCENVCKYIINNWEGIVNRYTLEVPGSCTEGQISHVLSERFSRHPMGWGKETLGKLSYLRVYKKNGKKIDKRIFEGEKNKELENIVERREKINWEIFDNPKFIFDESSPSQKVVKSMGRMKINCFGN